MLVTLFFLFPIYWLFMISFKTPDEIFSYPPKWYPGQIQFGSYAVLFKDGDADTVWNSFVIAGDRARCSRCFSARSALTALARFKTGGEHLANWIISQRMVPPIAVVFPDLLAVRLVRLGRHLSRRDPAVHRVQSAVRDLDDARLHPGHSARAGGIRAGRRLHALAGDLEGRLPDVAAPACSPPRSSPSCSRGTSSSSHWCLTRTEVTTYTVQVTHYFGGQSNFWAKISAMSVLGTLPIFIIVAFMQRYMVRGISLGAVKG